MSHLGALRLQLPALRRVLVVLGLLLMLAVVSAGPASAANSDPGPSTADPSETTSDDGDSKIANTAVAATGVAAGNFASEALSYTLSFIDTSTSPTVYASCIAEADGVTIGCWFTSQYEMLKGLAIWVMLPMALLAIIQSITKGSLFMMLKSMLIGLPIAILGAALATQVVQLLLYISDDMASVFEQSSRANMAVAFQNVKTFMAPDDPSNLDGSTGLLMVFLAIPLGFSCLVVWLLMTLRSASIYVATLFLPIGFALLIWPATAHYFRKLVQFLVAMILSKVVMMAGLSMTMSSFSAIGTGDTASMATSTSLSGGSLDAAQTAMAVAGTSGWPSFTTINQIILFTAMMVVVAFTPNALMKFLDNFSLADSAAALSQHFDKPNLVNQVLFIGRMEGLVKNNNETRKVATQDIPALRRWAAETSPEEAAMAYAGIDRKDVASRLHGEDDHGYEIDDKDLRAAGFLDQHSALKDDIIRLSESNEPNDWAMAHMMMAAGPDGYAGSLTDAHPALRGSGLIGIMKNEYDEHGNVARRVAVIMPDLNTMDGRPILRRHDPVMLRNVSALLNNGPNRATDVVYLSGLSGESVEQGKVLNQMRQTANRVSTTNHRVRVIGGEHGTLKGYMAARNTDPNARINKPSPRPV